MNEAREVISYKISEEEYREVLNHRIRSNGIEIGKYITDEYPDTPILEFIDRAMSAIADKVKEEANHVD